MQHYITYLTSTQQKLMNDRLSGNTASIPQEELYETILAFDL